MSMLLYAQALQRDTIHRLRSIQLFAESRCDQPKGDANDITQGNNTWFELAILQDGTKDKPLEKDGKELVWMSHSGSNAMKPNSELQWVCYHHC